MVSRVLTALLLSAISLASAAAGACTPGSEFEPPLCPLDVPTITNITILENAAKSPAEKDASIDCAGFRINERIVRRYFAKAKSTTAHDAHYTLEWSPCYASGEMAFADGRTGRWSIDQLRSGSLSIGGAEAIVLYCPKCRFRPFRWR